ncbi:MAG: MFS transporter [Eggerthellaceae bacterium]|jgi:OFA family oxalate/formate antiporter-like MFS transporter
MKEHRSRAIRTNGFTVRHAMVVLAGIIICFGPCGMVYNAWSVFVVPVSSSFGVPTSGFTFFITIVYLVGALAVPFAGNLMQRCDVRKVLSVSALLVSLGITLCSFWTEMWQFYISGIIEGIGIVSLMFLAVPTLINRWFAKRTGFFIGLCFAMSGLGGAVWSMLTGILIEASSWRTAYLVFGIAILAMTLPATTLLIRSYPEEIGLAPYGAEPEGICRKTGDKGPGTNGKSWGVPARAMFRSPSFYFLLIALGLFNALTVVVNLYASYLYHLADLGAGDITTENVVMLASSMAACLMVVAAVGKVSLGALSDKSNRAALIVVCSCGTASVLGLWLGQGSLATVYAAAVLGGFLYAAIDVLGAAFTRHITGPREYTLIYSRVALFVNLAGAVAATACAAVAEASWDAEWIMALTMIAASFISGWLALSIGERLEQTLE